VVKGHSFPSFAVQDFSLTMPDHLGQIGVALSLVLRPDVADSLLKGSAFGKNSVYETGHWLTFLARI
jgi:hypothetical protein